jgi:hypothetical protein
MLAKAPSPRFSAADVALLAAELMAPELAMRPPFERPSPALAARSRKPVERCSRVT